ncbi:MAG: autotransporter-associated beta strand repeat-containing protein [Thermoguttaceae bacterium]|nr:autotransporter-associated beta strand repeat-containing protein [Thermoguttaceae bacterium]
MRHLPLCLFLSLLVLSVGTVHANVIVNGVDTGSNSYTVKDSTDTAAVFTGTGTIIQTGSGQSPAKYTGSFTGFSGVLSLTRTTGEFWLLNGPNLVKGESNDLEMNIAKNTATLVFNDPDAANPISYHYSVLNGTGKIRTSNGTQVQTCTLVLGTDTENYTPQNGNEFSGNIIQWNISGNKKSNFNLRKVGTNTQTFSGDNSGFTKDNKIDVEGGVLESNAQTALGYGQVTVSSGASLSLNNTQTVSNIIVLNGTGYNGTGALRIYGDVTFTNNATVGLNGNTTLNTDSTIYVHNGATATFASELWGKSKTRTLTKTGEGTLTIQTKEEKNSIKGVVVQNGVLEAASANALGGGETQVSSGATLQISAMPTLDGPIGISGTGYNGLGALRITGDAEFTGSVTLDADSTVYVAENKTASFSNELAGDSNAYTLTKTGAGMLSIATAANKNSIKGVVIQAGVLEASSANALGGATSGNHVKLAGGTLRLSTAVGEITFDTTGTPKGAISVNNTSTTQSWDLANYQATADIDFVKIGAGTVRMTGNYSDKALKSAEIREGRIQIYGATAEEARVFPASTNVVIRQGASVEYVKNPQDFNNICAYSIYGGELISNISGSHLTTGHVGLYGGTLTGIGNGSNYGNFLFDGNLTAYQTDINGGVSNINAGKVDFGFRNSKATKAIQVKAGAQLNMNAEITSAFGSGVTYITKSGDGLLVFTKANTYNLPTNVNAGTLRLSEDGTLGNGAKLVTVKSGATLEIANTKTVANALTISGTGVSSAGAVNFTNDATISGAVTLGANSSVNVANGKIGKLTGSVSGASYTLTKTGAGTLRIDATESAFDVQDLIVSSGRLDFLGGTAGGITVQDAVFSPGNSPGEATVGGAFTLSSGNSNLLMEVAGTEPEQNDSLVVTGDLNLNDGLIYLELADTYSLNNGDRVTAILTRLGNYDPESDFIEKYVRSTIFTDLSYELLSTGQYAITATYDRNAIPEPSAWLLLALGFGGLMVWKKKVKG